VDTVKLTWQQGQAAGNSTPSAAAPAFLKSILAQHTLALLGGTT